jgi:sulfur carrier protein ThiS
MQRQDSQLTCPNLATLSDLLAKYEVSGNVKAAEMNRLA